MARSYKKLQARIEADPERRIRIEEYKRAMEDAVALAALLDTRHSVGQSPSDGPNATQAPALTMQRRDDRYLSTLAAYVADLGGHLELTAVFPNQTVTLVAPELLC